MVERRDDGLAPGDRHGPVENDRDVEVAAPGAVGAGCRRAHQAHAAQRVGQHATGSRDELAQLSVDVRAEVGLELHVAILTDAPHWRAMIDHLKLHVRDVERSRAFYEAALAPLGYRLMLEPAPGVVGMGAERPDFWLALDPASTSVAHVAFRVDRTDRVDAFHRAALDAGGRDNG